MNRQNAKIAKTRHARSPLKTILMVAGSLVLVALVGLLWFLYAVDQSLQPKVDSGLYASLVAERAQNSSYYAFLPKGIPQEATKVAFYHLPGFLQGSDIIALRAALPPASVHNILRDLQKNNRKEISSFGDLPSPHAYPAYGMKKPGGSNLFEGVDTLPADFRIFLFGCDLESIKRNWNHPMIAFTAVSEQRGEVVYFVEAG